MVGYAGRLGRPLRGEEAGLIHLLIAIYPRMYGQALAYALDKDRPTAEVVRVDPQGLEGELKGFDPQLVVCNEVTERVKALASYWVVLSFPRAIEATFCVSGRLSKVEDVGVADMLDVMDEAERLSAAT